MAVSFQCMTKSTTIKKKKKRKHQGKIDTWKRSEKKKKKEGLTKTED